MTDITKPPKVFISYAWESDTRIWVRELATRLRSNGVHAILDQWDVAPGDSLPEFMEMSVSASDFVLVVCTPAYKRKSDSSDPSGVGYEKGVITGELFVKRNQRKFIPVLRKGKWLKAAPSWVLGKNYIDLRGSSYSENNYQELIRTLYGKRESPPPLGTPPDFLQKYDVKTDAEKVISKQKEREAAEKTRLEVEEKAKQKVAREKIVHVIAEKLAHDKAEQESAEKVRLEIEEKKKATKKKLERQITDLKSRTQNNEVSVSEFDQIKLEINTLLSDKHAEVFTSSLIDLLVQVEIKKLDLRKQEILRLESDGDFYSCNDLIATVIKEQSELHQSVINNSSISAVLREIRDIGKRVKYKQKLDYRIRELVAVKDFNAVASLLQTEIIQLKDRNFQPNVELKIILSYVRDCIHNEVEEKKRTLDFNNAVKLSEKFSGFSVEDNHYHESLLREQTKEFEYRMTQFDNALNRNDIGMAEIVLGEAKNISDENLPTQKLLECEKKLIAHKLKSQGDESKISSPQLGSVSLLEVPLRVPQGKLLSYEKDASQRSEANDDKKIVKQPPVLKSNLDQSIDPQEKSYRKVRLNRRVVLIILLMVFAGVVFFTILYTLFLPKMDAATNTPPVSELGQSEMLTDVVDQTQTAVSVFMTLTAIPTPISAVTTTPIADLSTEITDDKGVKMALVPAGEFTMGNDVVEAVFDDQKPSHIVYLDSYYIDKYEVTNIHYKACVDANVCSAPKYTKSFTHTSYYGNSSYNNYPVIYVDWNMAKTYCEWRGAGLPTEAQWEKAARGTDRRVYPWSDEEISCDRGNFFACTGDTVEVGLYERGVSPYNLYDMAGNVWEWTGSLYQPYPYDSTDGREDLLSTGQRVLRGGSWDDSSLNARVFERYPYLPGGIGDGIIGFRCAKDANQ